MNNIVTNYIDNLYHNFISTIVTDLKERNCSLDNGLNKAATMINQANASGKKVMFIGNGGSSTVASHKALDFWFTGKIRGLSFSDYANLTAISNDLGYQNVFSNQIERFADKGDILFAISSSGNSENIILAVKKARNIGCKVLTFSGFQNTNRLRKLGDLNFYTPSIHYNQVESIDLLLCDCILEIILEHDKKKKK